jgi:hypothetical protein
VQMKCGLTTDHRFLITESGSAFGSCTALRFGTRVNEMRPDYRSPIPDH